MGKLKAKFAMKHNGNTPITINLGRQVFRVPKEAPLPRSTLRSQFYRRGGLIPVTPSRISNLSLPFYSS